MHFNASKEWVVVAIMFLSLVIGGGIAWGTLTQHVDDLALLEHKTEEQVEMLNQKVDLMSERISRIEGYLSGNENGYTAR